MSVAGKAKTQPEGCTIKKLSIEDSQDADLLGVLPTCLDLIQSGLAGRNGKVLVHCQGGISRSASFVVAFIMRQYQMSYDEALALVKAKRACIRPNQNFEE